MARAEDALRAIDYDEPDYEERFLQLVAIHNVAALAMERLAL